MALPLLAAAGIAAGANIASNLIGGFMGNKATNKTNATNLQIARENNQTSIDIANANNKLSYEMFLRQLEYASPSEQRRMLEEAGYNPAAYLQGSQASAASPPSLQQPSLTTPAMQAPTQLAQNISNLGMSLGSLYKDVSEAQLLNSQRQMQDINNETQRAMNLADLRSKGLYNEALQLDWSWKLQTQQDRILSEKLKNLALDAEKRLTLARSAHEEIDNVTRKQFNAKQLKQLDEAINLLVEEQNTEVSKQKLNEAGISEKVAQVARLAVMNAVDKYNAETNRIVGNSQANLNYVNSQLTELVSDKQRFENLMQKVFGFSEHAHEIDVLYETANQLRSGHDLNRMLVSQAYKVIENLEQRTKYLKKQNSWFEAVTLTNMFSSMLSGLKGSGFMPMQSESTSTLIK